MEISRETFQKKFGLILEGMAQEAGKDSNVLTASGEIPDKLWNTLTYLAETYVSADSCGCVLSDSLREKAIYLTLAVFLLKTFNNFVLRRNSSQITGAKEGEVSVSYQDIPNSNIRDWFLTDPSVQPFGVMLHPIIQRVISEVVRRTNCHP